MSKIGTTANTITLNYLPQNLIIGSASTDEFGEFPASLTQLNVSVNGTEIVSLASFDTIAQAFGVNNQIGGQVDAGAGLFAQVPKQTVLPLANGKIENVNCNITFTDSTTNNVYANSENLGTENFFFSTSTINSLSNNIYSDFRTLSFPQSDGEVIIQWKNGFSDKFVLDTNNELVALASSYMSNVVNYKGSPYVALFNYDNAIASVQYFNNSTSTAQTVVVQR